MEIIGVVLFLVAIGQAYGVLFDQKSEDYWKARFEGKRFRSGCIVPCVFIAAGICFVNQDFSLVWYGILAIVCISVLKFIILHAGSEKAEDIDDSPEVKKIKSSAANGLGCLIFSLLIGGVGWGLYDQYLENAALSKRARLEAEQERKRQEQAKKDQEHYTKIFAMDAAQFKSFVNDNYREFLHNRVYREYFVKRIDIEISAREAENKILLEEFRTIKKLDLYQTEKAAKLAEISEKGKANKKKIENLKEFKEYINKVFAKEEVKKTAQPTK